MYTRCPNCKTELNFKAPDNAAYLPDGYRHRIICPCCGIKIGVRIPKPHIIARAIEVPMAQPVIVEQPPVQEPQYAITPIVEEEPTPIVSVEEVASEQPTQMAAMSEEHSLYEPMVIEKKKSGIGRNIFMMILSLLFIGLSVCGYLVQTGVIAYDRNFAWVGSLTWFNGIYEWEIVVKAPAVFAELFATNVGFAIVQIMPMVLFTFACINFLVAFISACGKKYGRVWNLISGIIIGGSAIVLLFARFIMSEATIDMFVPYFTDYIIEKQHYFLLVGAGLGVIQVLFSLIFLAPLKKVRRV